MKKTVSLILTFIMVFAVFTAPAVTAAAKAGDANGDGSIDNKDVVVLFRYVSGSGGGAVVENCDYNGDGAIDNKDVVALFRAVSGSGLPQEFEEFVIVPDADATLSIPRVFGDHMVIQRGKKITVWGFSNRDGAKIRGTFMGDEARGVVKDGKWEITFAAKKASAEPQTLKIDDSCGNTLSFTDVLVGDVWIIGGQSNAEAIASDIPECGSKIVPDASKPLRLFQQGANYVINNRELAENPSDDIINPKWKWSKSNRAGSMTFSLLGWFFGDRLAAESGVPIGVVSIAASGAAISELMPKELANSLGYTTGFMMKPADYYNALTHPFLKMKFTGMVFCQGESETFVGANPPAANYARDFEALMTELRNRWGFDFPIYNIQLTDYTSQSVESCPNTGYVRVQQYNAYKNMNGVRLIPAYDLGADEGYSNYLHSPYKKELGDRVADLVLAEIYGKGALEAALAPEPETISVARQGDNKVVTVKFKNAGEGLKASNGSDSVGGFVYGRTKQPGNYAITQVSAKIISKDTVQITVPSKTIYIGCACKVNVPKTDVRLVNSYGLPATAFYLPLEG